MKARDAIKTEPLSSSVSILPHRDSLLLIHNLNEKLQPKDLDDDADTVSTMLSSCSSLGLGVTFAEPLVTEVRLRPYTSRQEKQRLFYNESDYTEFKRDYFYGTTRDTIVRFTESVVSHVWTVPRHEEPSTMYYTETELQRFLDEFVASLDKGCMDYCSLARRKVPGSCRAKLASFSPPRRQIWMNDAWKHHLRLQPSKHV
eukprot:CAMPEP_0202490670 /NCGR_PEP_ID=MMETSP1361-20130828/8005_1 /ASSEMBLY_ACC=CAM_ASM_000849 /TAXON_ID=210615 /ORGANISM="Staurosira complex sp., Strain CCMP2646" /LENGTH=200 /DNA_ID=CAMNT_0049120605 /DNA_START=58 /DNA_END=661 /DNA_ORIENTATION=-